MVRSIDSRAPLVLSGSLTTWTTTSWPGLSSSPIDLPLEATRPRRGTSDAGMADFAAGHDDLVDVQEAVLVEADVHEGGFQARQDVVDAALVDVADDGAAAAPLEVELGGAERVAPVAVGRGRGPRRPRARAAALGGRLARRLHQRDPGLPAIHADEHLLAHVWWSFQKGSSGPGSGPWWPPRRVPARRSIAGGRRPGMSRAPRTRRS